MHVEKNFDVVVIGNVGIDTNIYLYGNEIDFSVEANFSENLDYVGQAGGYSARGFAQLNQKTAFIGYVGQDFGGNFILAEFARDGINTEGVFIDPAGTSRSINFMYPDGRRKNFYDGKSHLTLQPDLDRCEQILSRARLALFHLPNWARFLLPLAKKHGLIVACDIQDVVDINDPYRQDFIEAADILFFSAVNQATPEKMMAHILQKYPYKIIVSGMGARGCALGTRSGIEYFDAIPLELPIIDTNGAGDGLAVGFLTSYILENYNLHDSIRRGQITARYTCGLKATTSRLITMEKLDEFLIF